MPSTTYLTPEAAQRLRHGGTWALREEILSVEGTPSDGEAMALVDPQGASLGLADVDLQSPVAVRRLSTTAEPLEGLIPRRLRVAMDRRARLVDDPRYCRVVNEDGDALPGLVVDRFEGHFAIQTSTRAMDARLGEVAQALADVADARSVILRNDGDHRSQSGLEPSRTKVLYGSPPRWSRLLELGARLTFDLLQGPGTGYSFSMREVRRLVGRLSNGARVLDPTCLVGGAVVQAGLHGARRILAFDPDPDAADLATENVEANGLMGRAHVECRDPLEALEALDDRFDLVLLHASAQSPDFGERQAKLIRRSVRATAHGGVLVVAITGAPSPHRLDEQVVRACADEGRGAVRLLRPTLPPDFPQAASAADELAALVLEIA
jgi:23S rRNA (cytosine1962-C5)-methyltransferase